jgi:hypothetical protein
MVTTFCLRLALGMIAPMMILPAAIVPPRFFRVQFLAALPLILLAGLFVSESKDTLFWVSTGLALAFATAGSVVWHTEEAPFGRTLFCLVALAAGGALLSLTIEEPVLWKLIDNFASALMLGAAISAMLMGHSYLIAPAMSLSPLNRLLGLLTVALTARIGLACVGLYVWTRQSSASTLDLETGLWLGARWLLGLIIPVGITWMAWETARIRSTQSATGILYVVTIVVFIGELLSMLVIEKTGLPL